MPPREGEIARINQILSFLKSGKPIGGRDRYGLIRQVGGEARERFGARVVEDTRLGPQGKSHSTWLIGHYGGGKSETLLRMKDALDESEFGDHKVLVCLVDLNIDFVTTASGLHLTLFSSGSFLSPKNTAEATRELAKEFLGTNPNPSQGSENVLSIGIDIATALLPFPTPGAGMLATSLFGKTRRAIYLRRKHVQKQVERLNFGDARATELMIKWMQYSLSPSETSWQALNEYIQGLSEARNLFFIMTQILKAAGYASIVILVDQAEKLVGNRTLTDAFMNIHGPEGNAGVNLFFVFAGTSDVNELKAVDEYGGFFRRFFDPRQCSCEDALLSGPIIQRGPNDDLERIRRALEQLRQTYAGISLPDLDNNRIRQIRTRLVSIARHEPVTWPMLWRAILDDGS